VMWTAQYPRIGSRSLVDFSGDGQIAPESVAGFDADIWAIDKAALGKHKSR